ncbi:MAG TPA: hypothetical protein VKG38_09005 [Solirubrobacteraceae bacterium]|nr:hypothetical protein [Solirubrobacteraceae bacterium]
MASLACLMHWYISMLYVVPVVAVGGWCWWSAKRTTKRRDRPKTRPSEKTPTPVHFETS